MAILEIVPVTFADAKGFISEHHRHHRPPVGHKFSIGLQSNGQLVGVISIGRPVARMLDDGLTAEVNRSCTDGTDNANSMLYGAAWRAAKAMGYRRLITYTMASESGASLRAAGWTRVKNLPPRKGWNTPSRQRTAHGVDEVEKVLWEVKSQQYYND